MRKIVVLGALLLVSMALASGGLNRPDQAQAAHGTFVLPFDPGETFLVCRGYQVPETTHDGVFALDLAIQGSTCLFGDNTSAGQNVRAPFTGEVVYYPGNAGLGELCIKSNDGFALRLTHLDPQTTPNWQTGDPVSRDEIVGKIADAGETGNNGVAHLHIELWEGSSCHIGKEKTLPFDIANGRAMSGCDLFEKPGETNQWQGELLTRPCEDEPPPPPPPNQAPTADAGGPYTTNEGTNVALDGTGSSDPDPGGTLIYAWDLDNDGQFDDSTSATPTFTMVGQDGVFTVRLRVSDGEETDTDSTAVTVNNVPPSVSLSSDAPVDEGSPVTVTGTVTDPGWLDPLSATIDWGDGTSIEPVGGVLENVRPDATLNFSVSHVYGDNGTFTAEVCASDDDTTTCKTIALQIDNVDPTAEIDMSGAILINGIPTFLAHIGDPLDFGGRSTDPGSDDLTLSWDWDDGSPIATTTYLVNPPNPDPFPSPTIQPRDVSDAQSHTFADACLYEIRFWAEDDDGGTSAVDTANVIIVGDADEVRSAGYWKYQFRSHLTGRGRPHLDQPTLGCYLDIAGYMSQVFDEVRDASTFELAHDVLFVKNNSGDITEMFDQQLLAAWLNFANGSIEYDQMVDTDGDGVVDTIFADAMAAAEAVRLDPTSTRAEIEEQKNILERLNLMG